MRGRGARDARTHFEVIEVLPADSLVEARLETGRTHQIRAHFAAIGHPVAGDPRYGHSGRLGLKRQFLHSARLAFTHPFTGERLEFESPLARRPGGGARARAGLTYAPAAPTMRRVTIGEADDARRASSIGATTRSSGASSTSARLWSGRSTRSRTSAATSAGPPSSSCSPRSATRLTSGRRSTATGGTASGWATAASSTPTARCSTAPRSRSATNACSPRACS